MSYCISDAFILKGIMHQFHDGKNNVVTTVLVLTTNNNGRLMKKSVRSETTKTRIAQSPSIL